MSGRVTRTVMIVLSVIGLGLASYLTYVHYSGSAVICTSDSCELVQTSVYSKLAGVPVALLGLIGYVFIFVSLILPEREQTRLATLGITAVGFGFSAYLTGREVFSLHQICEWCVSSACIMTILMLLSVYRFLTGGSARHPVVPADEESEPPGPHTDTGALGAGI
ncbi:MAG TPA: vitamin K epoxide reductase family protein [Solirubrobacteraceae bacterium]|nr:vitamin K epoxide reductase family protein [Solirubrobacteraceae bacterium]